MNNIYTNKSELNKVYQLELTVKASYTTAYNTFSLSCLTPKEFNNLYVTNGYAVPEYLNLKCTENVALRLAEQDKVSASLKREEGQPELSTKFFNKDWYEVKVVAEPKIYKMGGKQGIYWAVRGVLFLKKVTRPAYEVSFI